MNKFLLFLFLSVTFLQGFSNCVREEGVFYFIEFEIVSKSEYPVIMSGLVRKDRKISFDLKGKNEFIESFFKQCFYVPDLVKGYAQGISLCMDATDALNYLQSHKNQNWKFINGLSRSSIRKKTKLQTGESVFLKVVEISSSVWSIAKGTTKVTSSSNEIPIENIKEIEKIYFPFEISAFKKPRAADVEEMLDRHAKK